LCLGAGSPKLAAMWRIVILAAIAPVGCGDDPAGGTVDAGTGADADASVDARMDPPSACWPAEPRTPQGSAALGTGRDRFEPMPANLPLEYGAQDGFMLIANVRMTGFATGNPQDVLDPANPRTKIRAFFHETNVPLNYYAGSCAFRTAYVPTGNGDYELVEEAPVIFETCWRSEHLFGKKIRVELELMDGTGYTSDVKIVTAAPPIGYYPVDQGTPGCIH
jgi:hypothetical protein